MKRLLLAAAMLASSAAYATDFAPFGAGVGVLDEPQTTLNGTINLVLDEAQAYQFDGTVTAVVTSQTQVGVNLAYLIRMPGGRINLSAFVDYADFHPIGSAGCAYAETVTAETLSGYLRLDGTLYDVVPGTQVTIKSQADYCTGIERYVVAGGLISVQ